MDTQRIDDAIETIGALVSRAGGEGYEALDVLKDAIGEARRYREALEEIRLRWSYPKVAALVDEVLND